MEKKERRKKRKTKKRERRNGEKKEAGRKIETDLVFVHLLVLRCGHDDKHP